MEYQLSYSKFKSDFDNTIFRKVVLSDAYGDEVGHFTIEGKSDTYDFFDTGETCSMTISLEDEVKGQGWSTKMIRLMVENIKKDYPRIRRDQLLFIDADGSEGFWDHIGMVENSRYGYDYRGHRTIEGQGYEKVITFQELENFANRTKNKGRGRKTKRRKTKRNRRKTKNNKRTTYGI
jgi:hypothetical protein